MMRIAHKNKIMKAADLFNREYGRASYQAWLRREEEIAACARTRRYSVREICRMREDSFRQMKADGAKWAAAKAVPAVRAVAEPVIRIAA